MRFCAGMTFSFVERMTVFIGKTGSLRFPLFVMRGLFVTINTSCQQNTIRLQKKDRDELQTQNHKPLVVNGVEQKL